MVEAADDLRRLEHADTGIAEGTVEDEAGAKLRFGIGPLVGQRHGVIGPVAREHRARLDEDQLARDGDERRHVAHPVVVE
jgi:hypothetical protein